MMERKDIIESGILERYLLGELDNNEQAEVEAAITSDSELKAYFKTLESTFETLGHENAIVPPINVKNALLNTIKNPSTKKNQINSNKPVNLNRFLIIAASFAGLLLLGMYWMYSELDTTKKQLQLVEEQKASILEDLNIITNNLDSTKEWLDIINAPDAKQYILNGNSLSPEAKLISYVNDITKSVVINTKKLPKLDVDKDYQMWADVKGEMINMGIIDTEKELLAMTYIDNAESLNITIEPKGGNDHPTVSRLISNVYLQP